MCKKYIEINLYFVSGSFPVQYITNLNHKQQTITYSEEALQFPLVRNEELCPLSFLQSGIPSQDIIFIMSAAEGHITI